MDNLTRRSLLAGGAAAATVSALATPAHAAAPEILRVLAINIWLGGTVIEPGLELVERVIRQTGANVVLLSESGDATAKLATMMSVNGEKWSYVPSGDTGVLTSFPIIDSGHLDYITKAVIRVGKRSVACYAAHFEYRWYATYLPRGYAAGVPTGPYSGWDKLPGGPVTDLAAVLQVNADSGRPEVIDRFIADAATERAKGRNVILGGDFNEPSALDWTRAAANLFDHQGLVVPWQSTSKLAQAGYVDAYRTVFPNPATHPGSTWPANNVSAPVDQLTWAPEADERDRIDYIFSSPMPGLKLLDAGIVGPRGIIVRSQRVDEGNGDDVIASPEKWPTDHRAVMATYRLTGPQDKSLR